MATQALSQTLETEELEEGRLSERSLWTQSNPDSLSLLREVTSFSVFSQAFSCHLTLSTPLSSSTFLPYFVGHQMRQ